jgi:hypothetical protein
MAGYSITLSDQGLAISAWAGQAMGLAGSAGLEAKLRIQGDGSLPLAAEPNQMSPAPSDLHVGVG